MKSGLGNSSGDMEVGSRIREWRKHKGLLLKQLAADAGMDAAQLWAIESDRNSPSVRTLARIALALSITVADLLSTMPSNSSGEVPTNQSAHDARKVMLFSGELLIMRPAEHEARLRKRDEARMEKAIEAAADAEARRQTDIPTSLPLAFPIVLNEGGAEQLAHFLRAHLDIGSAVVRDVYSLFENHGVRILEDASLTDKLPAVTFYSARRRDFTVFLTKSLDAKPWRRDFLFLSEIGRIFVFASKKFEPFTNTDKSRRFAKHFAATFLQPAAAVRTAVYSLRIKPGDWTFELLLRLKRRFGVSAESFNIRLKELGLITIAKHAEFTELIKKHYGAGYDEPMPGEDIPPNRTGDIRSLDRNLSQIF